MTNTETIFWYLIGVAIVLWCLWDNLPPGDPLQQTPLKIIGPPRSPLLGL